MKRWISIPNDVHLHLARCAYVGHLQVVEAPSGDGHGALLSRTALLSYAVCELRRAPPALRIPWIVRFQFRVLSGVRGGVGRSQHFAQ